jgi:hypothetical protein
MIPPPGPKPGPNHHAQPIGEQERHHLRGSRSVIGTIAINHHICVRHDLGKHPLHDITLAASTFPNDRGAGGFSFCCSRVSRIVVKNIDYSAW